MTYTISGVRMLAPGSLSILPPLVTIQCTTRLQGTSAEIARTALSRVYLSDSLFVNVPGGKWLSEIGRYYPGLGCSAVAGSFSARTASRRTLLWLLCACARKKRLFTHKTKLEAVFEGFPYGPFLTLMDLLRCANGTRRVTLDTVVDLSKSFLRATIEGSDAHVHIPSTQSPLWRLAGQLAASARYEICNVGAIAVDVDEEDEDDGDFMVVDDDEEEEEEEEEMESPAHEFVSPQLPSSSEEDEDGDDSADEWLASRGYSVTSAEILALPPSKSKASYVRVAANERSVLSILIADGIKGLGNSSWDLLRAQDWRKVGGFHCYHITCASQSQAYEVAWKLYYSRAHDYGAPETRTACITLYACVRSADTKELAKCKERYDKHADMPSETQFPYKDRYNETHPAPGLAISRPAYVSTSERRAQRELRTL